MEKSEEYVREAQEAGHISKDCDAHVICADICTIVKGCIFEWCLEDGQMDVEAALRRMVGVYMRAFLVS